MPRTADRRCCGTRTGHRCRAWRARTRGGCASRVRRRSRRPGPRRAGHARCWGPAVDPRASGGRGALRCRPGRERSCGPPNPVAPAPGPWIRRRPRRRAGSSTSRPGGACASTGRSSVETRRGPHDAPQCTGDAAAASPAPVEGARSRWRRTTRRGSCHRRRPSAVPLRRGVPAAVEGRAGP